MAREVGTGKVLNCRGALIIEAREARRSREVAMRGVVIVVELLEGRVLVTWERKLDPGFW